MSFDTHSTLAYSTVASITSQSGSTLVLDVQAGDGAKFALNQQVTIWPVFVQPLLSNAMICRVTNILGDTITLDYSSGNREGSSVRSVTVGDQISNTVTPKVLTDIETALGKVGGDTTIKGQGLYLMSTFRNGAEHLYLFASGDGIKFIPLNPDYSYDPPTVNFRDPSIIYYNNMWYVCYSHVQPPGYTGTTFGIASSPDLINWTFVQNVDVSSVASAYSVWAPEWFVDTDGSLHIVCAISTDTNTTHQIYETHPSSNNDPTGTWSTPVKLVTSGGATNIIDPFLVYVSGTYYLWYHDGGGYIGMATSSTLTGTYAVQKSGDWAGWGLTSIEGPSLVQITSTTWRIYFDYPTSQGIYYSESSDGFQTWTTKALISTPDFTAAHPTILRITNVVEQMNIIGAYLANAMKFSSVKARAYLSTSAQSIASATFTKVAFNATSYAQGGNFDTSNHYFIAPTTGYYDIRAAVLFTSMTSGHRMILRVYKNGTTLMSESQAQSSSSNDDSCIVSDVIQLTAGDTLEVQAYQDTGGSINLSPNSAQTYMTVRLAAIS